MRHETQVKLYRFQSVKSMLKSGQDREPLPELVPIPFPVQHENLRGPDYYASVATGLESGVPSDRSSSPGRKVGQC